MYQNFQLTWFISPSKYDCNLLISLTYAAWLQTIPARSTARQNTCPRGSTTGKSITRWAWVGTCWSYISGTVARDAAIMWRWQGPTANDWIKTNRRGHITSGWNLGTLHNHDFSNGRWKYHNKEVSSYQNDPLPKKSNDFNNPTYFSYGVDMKSIQFRLESTYKIA